MALILTFLVCLFLFAALSLQDDKDPVRDFCRRWGHQTAVIDRKLYIDGGHVDWNPLSQNPDNYTNTWLLYNDLDTQVPGSDKGMPQLYANLSKNDSVPSVSGGVLWADEVNKIFYLYGGEFDDSPTNLSLYGYDTVLNQWNETSTPSYIKRASWGAGVSINDRAEGYYLGGWLSSKSVPGWSGPPIVTSNLIKYDMATNTWTNNTGPDNTGRAEGSLIYLPASDGGLLVYFGGILWYPNGTVTGSDMNSIHIFDLASQKWYTQQATGDTPENRRKFCAGATWAEDHSSYNIYLYGGQGIQNITGFDDVYILTLPSFQWIKWYPRVPGEGNPHGLLSCNVISNSQMLIIGGWFNQHQDCDSANVWGTHNLNLGEDGPNNATWDLYWPNITEYNVPPEIVQKIGGGPSGRATLNRPQNSWDDRDLPVYFSRVPTFANRTPTRTLPTPTGNAEITNSTQSGTKHDNNTAKIAGGVAGGVVGLILLLVLIWYCVPPKNQKVKEAEESPEKAVVSMPPSELPTEPPQELSTPYHHESMVKRGSAMAASEIPPYHQRHFSSQSYSGTLATSPPPMTRAPSYPSPSTPYDSLQQAQYFGQTPPPPTNATGLFTATGSPPATFSPTYAVSPETPATNPAHHSLLYEQYQQQHFPPPPSASAYDNTESYPPTTSSTPAHFYPQPLHVPRRESDDPRSYTPPSRGRFVEQGFH